MYQSEINIHASSNHANSFTIQLDEPISIPKEAKNVQVSVEQSEIWWNVPNISAGKNKLYITQGALVVPLTIPTGLYDVDHLNLIIKELYADTDITPDAFTFKANAAQNKIEIVFNVNNMSIDFTQTDTIRDLLGFDSQVVTAAVIFPSTFIADNTAAFNSINYFVIHSDITDRGLSLNGKYSQALAIVLIDEDPGYQLTHEPFNPPKTDGGHLIGSMKSRIKFWLTDDSNNEVDTLGESWSCRLSIKFLLPYT